MCIRDRLSRVTNGPSANTTESSSNKIMMKTLDFDASTTEYAQFNVRMPKGWDEGVITARFLWSSTSSGNVVWGLQGVSLSDDDVIDAAFGGAQTVTDAVTATTDLMQTAATSSITIGGSPSELDLVVFQVYRDAANGSDTLTVDAKLVGVVINYTTTSISDA